MKLLVLTSRYTATRDIISEDFGRQTRLFSALAKRGHTIHFYCADYRKRESRNTTLHGIKVLIRPFGIFSAAGFCSGLVRQLRKEGYDALVATSDPLWGVVGRWAARKAGTRLVYDLHDNYETYATYSLPFMHVLERKAVRDADAITTVSHSLGRKIAPMRKENVFVAENGADMKLFRPLPRERCRKALGLPARAKLIGYMGSIQRSQGIDVLLEAFAGLRKDNPDLLLVIAGRFYGDEEKYLELTQEGIRYLGSLNQDEVVKLINACDAVVVPNRKNAFTEYCFPYKVVEYMACNVPIVATRVGDVALLLSRFKESLCEPDDAEGMAAALKRQLGKGRIPYRKHVRGNTWDAVAGEFEKALAVIGRRGKSGPVKGKGF